MHDELGDRMKEYEKASATKLMPLLPAFCRIDGKNFHKWTKNCTKPFDNRLIRLMTNTTMYLCQQTNPVVAYTQSDEITLCWIQPSYQSQLYFDGKVQKLCSVLASMTAAYFNKYNNVNKDDLAVFDCRVWNVPNLTEAYNTFLWRQNDASRNSIQMATRSVASHKECNGLNTKQLQELYHKKSGRNWNDLAEHLKRGTFITKVERECSRYADKTLTTIENYKAFVYEEVCFPKLSKMENAIDVLFKYVEPIMSEE